MLKTVMYSLALALTACGAIDNAVKCDEICDRYKTCFNADYDVPACATRCRSNSKDDTSYTRQVDICSACINDQSCTSATFSCASSCGNVVP
jgi:hypothetical protein